MNKKQIDTVLMFGNSHTVPIEGLPIGITKFQVFLAIKPLLKGNLYWYTLRNAYEMSDNLFSYRHDLKRAFQSSEPERESLMNKKERDYINALPEQLTIYRGMTELEYKSGDFGISWTLKKETASFFANDYPRNYATNHLKKVVHELVINKSEVIAFFNARQEFDIIYISI